MFTITSLQLLKMFLLVITGFIAFRSGLITHEGNKSLSNLLLYIVNPMMIINSFATEYTDELMHGLLWALALSFATYFLSILIAHFIIPASVRSFEIDRFACVYSNCGFMGIPLVMALFGSTGVLYLSAYIAVFSLFVWTHGYMLMTGSRSLGSFVKGLRSPAVIAVIIGCIILYFAGLAMGIFGNGGHKLNFNNNQSSSKTVTVPSVIGYSLPEAIEAVNKAGLTYDTIYEKSATVASNHIISTSPAANESIEEKGKITLVVSMEGEGVAVPSVIGKTEAEATSILDAEGFQVLKERAYDSGIVKGNVISQSPAPESLMSRDGTVSITISLGADKSGEMKMPKLIGMSEEAAKKTLNDMGLVCSKTTEVYNSSVAEGLVCEQSITEGATVMTGTDVEIKLSRGEEKKYYDCDYSVSMPPDYQGGDAKVTLTVGDAELFNTTTTSFPVDIRVSRIFGNSKGKVRVVYTVMVDENTHDEAGNVNGTQKVPAEQTQEYDIEFRESN